MIPGSLQTSKTRKQHEISDAKRDRRAITQTSRFETQVMATTLEERKQASDSSSVVRSRDIFAEDDTDLNLRSHAISGENPVCSYSCFLHMQPDGE